MTKKTISIRSEANQLELMRQGLHSFLGETSLSQEIRDNIAVAIGEACTNSIQHAYNEEPGHEIKLTMHNHPNKVVFKIRDYGKKIDISKVQMPKLPPDVPRGLGIHFMRKFMDEFGYDTSCAEGNELTLVKYKSQKKDS